MHLDDIVHRALPIVGPLAFFVAVTRQHRYDRSPLLQVCSLSLGVTLIASALSAWLGLRFDESHDLPDWYKQAYWWSTQWVAPVGYAIAGLAFLVFSLRRTAPQGGSQVASKSNSTSGQRSGP
jgi:hypothetical protein